MNAVEARGGSLSLPPGVQDLEQLLADERISRLRVQQLFEWLAGLGQLVGGKRISLADPEHGSVGRE